MSDEFSQPLTVAQKRRALQNLGICALMPVTLLVFASQTGGDVAEAQIDAHIKAMYRKGEIPVLNKPGPAPAVPSYTGDDEDRITMRIDPSSP